MAPQIEQISNMERKLTFSVPANEVKAELERHYKTLQKKVRLPGFRPGKAPRKMLMKRFGDKVSADVANVFLQKTFQAEIQGMDFFGTPRVETEGVELGKDFEYCFILEVEPEFELTQYKDVDVVYPKSEVAQELVDADITAALAGQASLAEVTEKRAVKEGDMVLAELEITEDKEVLHAHAGTMINVGDETFYKGLDTALVGRKKSGRNFNTDVTFADDAQCAEVAGKTARAKVKILAIQEMQVPELSDEVAESLGYAGGAEGMKAAVRAKRQEGVDSAARNQARANLLQKLVELNVFDVPAGLTDQFLQALMQELRVQQMYQGKDPRKVTFSDAQVEDLRGRASFAAKASLILKKVAEVESIGVDDADMEARVQEIADARGQAVEAIKGYLAKEDATQELRDRLLEEKTLDWLLEQSNLQDEAPAAGAEEEVEAKPKAQAKAKAKPKAKAEKAETDAE